MKLITFSLPQEALGTATGVVLLGDFNNWEMSKAIVLKKQKDGTWKASVKLKPGQSYEYRFLLNDGRWVNDWSAKNYVHKQHFGVDNSVIFVGEETKTVSEKPVSEKKIVVTAKPKTAKTTEAKTPGKKIAKVAETIKNDLTKIEGIGPATAQLLEKEGIHSFKDLGKATSKKIKGILDAAGSKFAMHDPKSWPKQAKLAAAEKWDELKALQKELLGGE